MNHRSIWSFGRRQALATLVGVLVYGILSWLTNTFPVAVGAPLQIGAGILMPLSIRPGVAVPIMFGFVFGPISGFLTGMFGNMLGDWWTGYLVYPPSPFTGNFLIDVTQGYILNWQIGNGLMGLVPGLALLMGNHYRTVKDYVRALAFVAVGIIVGMGLAAFTDIPLDDLTVSSAVQESFVPVVLVNLFNAIILIPILLYNREHLDLHSTGWLHSGLMRRLLLVVLISAALPVALLGLFLTQQIATPSTDPTDLTVKLIFTVILTLAFTITNAALLAQSISRSLLRLTQAAQTMEEGKLASGEAAQLAATTGTDEVSRLSQVFGKMAGEVIQREENLKKMVEQLKIEVDETKKAQQVAEITDTDYFRDLQTKAKQLRKEARN